MSVAAPEAVALQGCLAGGDEPVARRFFRQAAAIVDHAWEMAVGGDLALPEVHGPRPLRLRLSDAYFERALHVAEADPEVAAQIIGIGGMLDGPQRLLRPAIARRVVKGRRPAWGGPRPSEDQACVAGGRSN